MSYELIGFINDNPPAINAENLNHMDRGIYNLDQQSNAFSAINDVFEKKSSTDIMKLFYNDSLWYAGYVTSSGNQTPNNRYRTSLFYLSECVTKITAASGYVFNLYRYNKSGVYQSRLLAETEYESFRHDIYDYRVCIQKSTPATLNNEPWKEKLTITCDIYGAALAEDDFDKILELATSGKIDVLNDDDFENGSINSSGNNMEVGYAIRTKTYLDDSVYQFVVKSGFHGFLVRYDLSETFVDRIMDVNSITLDHSMYKYRVSLYESTTQTNTRKAHEMASFFTKQLASQSSNTDKCYYSVNNGVIAISTPKVNYTVKRVTANNIRIDTWRLYSGILRSKTGEELGELWSNSDVEGAIKLVGEEDFLGGYHGDEIMSSAVILADGKPLDITTDVSGVECSEITVNVVSNIYHCNTSEIPDQIAFVRTKNLKITKDGYTVENRYIAQSSLSIDRAAMAMVSARKTDYNGNKMLYYLGSNSDIKLYASPEGSSGDIPHSQANRKMTVGSIYMNGAIMTLSMIYGQDNPGYNPFFNNMSSQNRMKIYFDQYDGQTVAQNEVLQDEFSVTFK